MGKILTRRDFLKCSAAVLPAAAIPLALGMPAFANDSTSNKPKFSKEYDIIVVGSGLAGITAAIRAAELGNKVLVIEKMPIFGGTSLVSGLNFSCVNSPFQEKEGIEDKPEWYAEDMAKVAGNYGSKDHALLIAQTTRRVYDFWTDKGVEFKEIKKLGGHKVKRALWAEGGGRGVMLPLYDYINNNLPNCHMVNNTKLDDLLFDETGKVIGIEVRENYRFNYDVKNDDKENTTGKKAYYKAKKGVIIATGGFCRDVDFMSTECSFLQEAETIANPGALSGTIRMLAKNNAHPVNMALFRFAFPIPTEDLRWGMLIDVVSGKRFINELNGRNILGPAILRIKAENGGKAPIVIYDSIGAANFHDQQRLHLSLEGKNGLNGTIYKFNTLDEIEDYFKINKDLIKNAAKEYNEMIAQGEDKEFHKDIKAMKGAALSKAPFYVMVCNPRITYTPGGIRISTKGEVISLDTGKAIKGLFACGEVTGGIHGESRLTAGSSPDCGTFGLIAAESCNELKA